MSATIDMGDIIINLFPGGMDSPTFMDRRKVTFNVWYEAESLQLIRDEHDDGYASDLMGLLRQFLLQEQLEREKK